MIAPTVHLNGTSGERLLDQLEVAMVALQTAIKACEDAAPNARDYPSPHRAMISSAFTAAQSAHQHHLRTLVTLRDNYQASYDHVARQIDERRRR